MNTQRVSREQAEMLKKVGYDVPTQHYYCEHIVYGVFEETGDECDYNNGYSFHWSRPTIDEAARWLREVKGWHVKTQPIYMNKSCWEADIIAVPLLVLHDTVYGDTHDLALSAGIDLILKKLEDGN
jgi:hypothetical protein